MSISFDQPSAAERLQEKSILAAERFSRQLDFFTNALATSSRQQTSLNLPKPGNISSELDPLLRLLPDISTLPDLIKPEEAPKVSLNPITYPTIPNKPVNIQDIPEPTLSNIPVPTIANNVFQGTAPTIGEVKLPTRPTLNAPQAPTLQSVKMPIVEGINLPIFDRSAVFDDLLPPSEKFTFSPDNFRSSVSEQRRAVILGDLMRGGYGLNASDEQYLYLRDKERILSTANTAINQATKDAVSRGFSLPPGSLSAQIASARQDGLEKIAAASSAIYSKRMDMYAENRKFAITQSAAIEELDHKIHQAAQEMMFNISKYAIEVAASQYDQKVARFNALNEGFKTYISEYEARVQAELNKVEKTKLELQIALATNEINKNEIEVFNAQLEGVGLLANVYKTDVEAANSIMQMEKAKIEAYGASITAFAEGVKADSLRVAQYEALVRADSAKVDVFKARLDAQRLKAEVARTEMEAAKIQNEVAVSQARTEISRAETTSQMYKDRAQSVAASNSAQAEIYRARTEAFKAIAGVVESSAKIKSEHFAVETNAILEAAKNEIDAFKIISTNQLGATVAGADAVGKALQAQLNQVIAIATSST